MTRITIQTGKHKPSYQLAKCNFGNTKHSVKILFIIPSVTNYFTFLEDISGEMQREGHQVYLAASTKHISDIDCYDRAIHGELREIDFPRGFEWSKHLKAAKQLRAIVEEVNPDLINVHFSAAMFTTAIAKRDNWPRTIAMIHGMAYPILRGWRKMAIGSAERWAARKMDGIILLNEIDRQALAEHIPADKIKVLDSFGLGCDLSKFDQQTISEEVKLRFHRRLGVRKEDFVFIFVGRQVDFKGFDKLIRAFLSLYEDRKNLKLLLVGAKDNIHPTNLTEQEELEMNRCPGIMNIGWKENVHEYLCVADVNVFPSEREGMPVNLMESLALGIPVITTNSRGCNEVVSDGVNGLLIEENTVEAISAKMLHLYEDREELELLSSKAIEHRMKFDRQKFISAMLALFEFELNSTKQAS